MLALLDPRDLDPATDCPLDSFLDGTPGGSAFDRARPALLGELVALQRAADRAEAAFTAYVDRVAAERRALHPGPERLSERAVWPEEQALRLEVLRAAYAAAVAAVHAHPLLRRARERHGSARVLAALRAVAARSGAAQPGAPAGRTGESPSGPSPEPSSGAAGEPSASATVIAPAGQQ